MESQITIDVQYIIQVRKVNRGYAEESLFHSA